MQVRTTKGINTVAPSAVAVSSHNKNKRTLAADKAYHRTQNKRWGGVDYRTSRKHRPSPTATYTSSNRFFSSKHHCSAVCPRRWLAKLQPVNIYLVGEARHSDFILTTLLKPGPTRGRDFRGTADRNSDSRSSPVQTRNPYNEPAGTATRKISPAPWVRHRPNISWNGLF